MTHLPLHKTPNLVSSEPGAAQSVIISLESTGVVMGEFGFANALRDKLEVVRRWQADSRPEVRAFADAHIHSLQLRIVDEQRRAEERKALRELEYDQGDELKKD